MTEFEFHVDTIRGAMLGIEFPSKEDFDQPDLKFAVVIDLVIFRFMLLAWDVNE